MQTSNWYAVTTRPNGERKAHADLTREHVTVFFPRNRCLITRKLKCGPVVREVELPLYPRYLFVNLPSTWFWRLRKANCRLVSLDPPEDDQLPPQPTRIPDPIMEVLMAGADATGLLASKAAVTRARFKAMAQVRFNEYSRAFAGIMARVVEDDGSDVIPVLLEILGSERQMRVRADTLQAA